MTAMGFRATDDDSDDALQVIDGTATAAELTPQQHCELFIELCTKLRALGATEVRAERYRAVFAAPLSVPTVSAVPGAAPVLTVTRVQLGPKPKPAEEPLTLYEGEQLSEADKERRRSFAHIADLVGRG